MDAAPSAAPIAPVAPSSGRLRPIGIDAVALDGGFWGARQALARDAILPHIEHWEERLGWLGNFDATAAGTVAESRTGREFSDSEAYKLLEAMAWQLAREPEPELQRRFDAIVARVAAAQQPDGYLSTRYGSPGQPERYSNLEWGHELYCFGHLIQAGVARLRSGHRDALVGVTLRAADHVCAEFGTDGRQGVCGHPEIEVALVELYRATGIRRYLDQARLFLDRRGHGVLGKIHLGAGYFQDDVPIAEATTLRGHAVRALYLTAGAVDAAVEQGDRPLLSALERQYRHTLQRRTYLTGGMGSRHEGEAFGDDFELPPDRGYCETCAGVASVMVAWRLLLQTGDLGFADVVERTLYNVVAASPREDGRAFFYTNPLQRRAAGHPPADDEVSPRADAQLRAPWFEVSCCPPNVARTLASLGTFIATHDDAGVQLLQYASGEVATRLAAGAVRLRVATGYPDDGRIAVTVLEAPDDDWALTLRVPAWASGATVTVDSGEPAPATAPAVMLRALRAGAQVTLTLPVTPRWVAADPRVSAVRGSLAVECGPLVLCAESVDLPVGRELDELRVVPEAGFRSEGGRVLIPVRWDEGPTDAWPYGSPTRRSLAPTEPEWLPLLPYHHWANRGPASMQVWLATAV